MTMLPSVYYNTSLSNVISEILNKVPQDAGITCENFEVKMRLQLKGRDTSNHRKAFIHIGYLGLFIFGLFV